MTDELHPWGAPEAGQQPGAGTAPPAEAPAAGWYPDPWSGGHHRYWDGTSWTAGTFPHGPAKPWSPEGLDAVESAPPWSPPPAVAPNPPESAWAPAAPVAWEPPVGPGPASAPVASNPSRLPTGLGFVALVVGVMILVGSLGTLGGYLAFRHRASTPSASDLPPAVVPIVPGTTVPTDPAAASLSSLVVTQADVPPTVIVQPDRNGDQVAAATPTLDLCNGTYPSESHRTARLQVTAFDGAANGLISTEAVLYDRAAATEQAFTELKSVAANCPSTPVVSPVGEPTSTTHFNAAPDSAWAATPTVTRQAFDLVQTDDAASTDHSIAVYLRRGRVLMGIYFGQPDSPQVTVAGQSTIETIAGVFAARLAQLPASVVNG